MIICDRCGKTDTAMNQDICIGLKGVPGASDDSIGRLGTSKDICNPCMQFLVDQLQRMWTDFFSIPHAGRS